MKTQVNFDSIGGGGLTIDLTNMVQNPTNDQFPATVGKKYLVLTTHGGAGGAVLSGGTVESYYQYQAGQYVYLAVITATASTVVMKGSGNKVNYVQLD